MRLLTRGSTGDRCGSAERKNVTCRRHQRFGTMDGPSIRGGGSRLICSSIKLQSGLSAFQAKPSNDMSPLSRAAIHAQTKKLLDFLIHCSCSLRGASIPLLRTNFASARCCSENGILQSTSIFCARRPSAKGKSPRKSGNNPHYPRNRFHLEISGHMVLAPGRLNHCRRSETGTSCGAGWLLPRRLR
jgi:hypothetical protein